MDDEFDLLQAAKAGDTEAFVRLVERHSRHMLGIAHGITGDRRTAEEVVVAAALAAWRERTRLRGDAEAAFGRLARVHALAQARRV